MTTQIPVVVRPRMRTDMAFLETQDGVYVRGHGDGFVIRGAGAYRYLSALLPHLDGSTRLSDLLDGLPPAHAESVRSLIVMLAARGVITDVPESDALQDPELRARFSGQIALLEQHGDDGTGFLRAATARVLVVSEDPAHAAALADALTANGVGSAAPGAVLVGSAAGVSGADVVCLIAADRPSPALFDLAERARAAGAAFVPLVRIGDRLVLGPWQHGESACAYSAVLRMSDNGIPGSPDVWQAAGAGAGAAGPVAALPGTAVSIAVSIAGFEVFKALTGGIACDLDDAVVIVDPDRLTVGIERVVAHPASPHEPVYRVPEDDGADMLPVERAYQRFERVVAGTVGIMRAFDDDALSQIPVKVSALIAPAADPAPIVAFGSETLLEARVAALEEAALRYALNIQRRCGLLAPAMPGAEVVAAERLQTWLGGAPLSHDPLVAGTDLAGGSLAIPRAAVLAGPWDRRNARFEPDLVGAAAGDTPQVALSRALFGAAGAYTIAAVARGDIRAARVDDPAEVEGAEPQQLTRLAMLVDAVRQDGRSVVFHQAHGLVPVAIVLVRDGAREELLARAGSTWLNAAESALLALVGEGQLAGSPTGWATGPCLPAAPALDGFSLTAAEDVPAEPVDHDLVVARLRAAGLRAGAVDLTPPDLAGVTTVTRVLLFRGTGLSQ
ncbi:hypothetical protein [Acrocarpospora catenulata]|uniref:hypothetical protein n=1 Tax=Acrocarpospora catenulata TaxID=2836182 RepID=UPI001BDA08C1|nr:hypothetical protein [Acrocarpospora catenulata]